MSDEMIPLEDFFEEPQDEEETPEIPVEQETPDSDEERVLNTVQRLRVALVKDNRTLVEAMEIRANNQISQEEIDEEGWVKLRDWDKFTQENGIPHSKFMKAFGGDRSMLPPVHEWFQVRWKGRIRYVRPECMTEEALDIIRNIPSATRKRKEVSEDTGEGEVLPDAYEDMTKRQLLKVLQSRGMSPGSKMSKNQLLELAKSEQVYSDGEGEETAE